MEKKTKDTANEMFKLFLILFKLYDAVACGFVPLFFLFTLYFTIKILREC